MQRDETASSYEYVKINFAPTLIDSKQAQTLKIQNRIFELKTPKPI